MKLLLETLSSIPPDQYVTGPELAQMTGLDSADINVAVALLLQSGYVEWQKQFGTAPYDFAAVVITPQGRYEFERINSQPLVADDKKVAREISLPPIPIGSPFGFSDEDWEIVSTKKENPSTLFVCLGNQFESKNYNTDQLISNLHSHFQKAINNYNKVNEGAEITLDFLPLRAGYGEHLFNEIARDIIGSDIAIFETSDQNPNVMIEMGVALTWGSRVLPVKLEGQDKPPSDISGQTWLDHKESGAILCDKDAEEKIFRMVERAIKKKRNPARG